MAYYVNAGGQQVAGPVGLIEAIEIKQEILDADGIGVPVSITEDEPDEDEDEEDQEDEEDEE